MSLAELLASDVDVVHVTSPNALHASHLLAALRAGKHVICEKPMAVGLSDAEAMHQAAADSGRVAALCFNQRFYPQLHQAAELVAAGSIGGPHLVHGRYLQDWLLLDTDWNWRLDPSLGGPLRAVADVGSHWLDAAQFVLGSPISEVFADLHILHHEGRRPDRSGATFADASEPEASDVGSATHCDGLPGGGGIARTAADHGPPGRRCCPEPLDQPGLPPGSSGA